MLEGTLGAYGMGLLGSANSPNKPIPLARLWTGFSTKDYARDYAKYPVFFVYDSTPLLGISLRPNSCGQMPDFDTARLSTPSGKWSWS